MATAPQLYGKKDPRELPNYTISEAASYLSIPKSTVRAWVKGMGEFRPVIELPDPKASSLSFLNLVELHMLDSLRHLGPALPEIRKSISFLKRDLGVRRPLATEAFFVDGARILVNHLGTLVEPARAPQMTFQNVLSKYLTRVEYSKDGLASRLFPFTRRGVLDDPRSVVFDPLVSFGRLVLSGTGIPTVEVAERFHAGEDLDDLARDFNVEPRQIQEAIRCELHLKMAA